jgi:hypothetical protein
MKENMFSDHQSGFRPNLTVLTLFWRTFINSAPLVLAPLVLAPLVLAPIGTSDHCSIIWSSQEQMKHKQKSKRINVRPLKSSSLQAFEQYISEYNWSPVLNASCI